MLDESEFRELEPLLSDGLRATKEYRAEHGVSLDEGEMDRTYKPALDTYERMTGLREMKPEVLWHHRVSLYGQPCQKCGRPRRTPQAKDCIECGG